MFGIFNKKRQSPTLLTSNIDEEFLLMEARDFLRNLIVDNTHRISKWNKRFDYGSASFYISAGFIFEVVLPKRIRLYKFSLLDGSDVVVRKIEGGLFLDQPTIVDKNVDEIGDLLKLLRYVDLVNTSRYQVFKRELDKFYEVIRKMDWDYSYDYSKFGEALLKRVNNES